MRRLSIGDFERDAQPSPQTGATDLLRHKLDPETELQRAQRTSEADLDEVGAYCSRGQRHRRLGSSVATADATQERMPHGDTE